MNIAIIIERFNPESGGAERSTAEVAVEMQARGHQVTILTGKSPIGSQMCKGEPGAMEIRICPLGVPKGIARLLYFRRWVRGQLSGGRFDASLSVTSAVPAMVVEPRAGLIRDIQARSFAWRYSPSSRLLRKVALWCNLRQRTLLALEEKTLHDPDVRYVACISRMVREQCLRHHPDLAAKLVHVPNAVKPIQADAGRMVAWHAQFRHAWAIAESQTVFIFPGLDSRRKGLTPLLHALALLRGEHPKSGVVLVLVGQVHASHQKLIRKLKLESCIRAIGFQKDLRPCYSAADVTILPTYYDTFGRVVIESLLLGRPAITTLFAGAAEIVEPGGEGGVLRGRVVDDPDDHAALAEAMYELCDPVERKKCVDAIGDIAATYTTRHHVDRLLELFMR